MARPTTSVEIPIARLRREVTELERERAVALGIEPATARGETIYHADFRAGTLEPVECRIQLDVAAFLSAESVAGVYAAARRLAWAQRLIGGRIPTPGRALSAKMIKLAAFVARARRKRGSGSWGALRARWDRYYPEWAYGDGESARRHFARDCKRAAELLVGAYPPPLNFAPPSNARWLPPQTPAKPRAPGRARGPRGKRARPATRRRG